MGWVLAVDFGTSFTVAAVSRDGGPGQLLDLAGDGSMRIPSSVAVGADGGWRVGRDAVREAMSAPYRFERAPKRLVGQPENVLLGELTAPVSSLIAAVLDAVRRTALTATGGLAPDALGLTYPATWQEERKAVLVAAAREAGFHGKIHRVREPVAAAIKIAAERVATGKPMSEGERVAVYDLGGGTFDAAVLQRVQGDFKVLGEPGGLETVGGDTFDQRIFDEHLARSPLGQHEHWALLTHPPDSRWHRARALLTDSIRDAKEQLSRHPAATIWVPEINQEYQLTRTELNDLIARDIDATVEALAKTIGSADLTNNQLTGVFLVGASSRIPLVADTIWNQLNLQPDTEDDPKAVVALGATQWTPPRSTTSTVTAASDESHGQPVGDQDLRGLGRQPQPDQQPHPEIIAALETLTQERGFEHPGGWESHEMLVLAAANLRTDERLVDIATVTGFSSPNIGYSSPNFVIVTDERLLLIVSNRALRVDRPDWQQFPYPTIVSAELGLPALTVGRMRKKARTIEDAMRLNFRDGSHLEWYDIYPPGRAGEIVLYVKRRIAT
jgi:molecular chaperone DnaK